MERESKRRASYNLKDLIHEAIYYDQPLPESGVASWMTRPRSSSAHLNIVMSMVDTGTARLTKRRPMPVISADDAGWSEKLFAKKTSRILRRKMGGRHVEQICPQIIRDFIIRGDGCAKIVREGGDVGIERIPVYELVWDESEARYNCLRTLAHVRPMSREVLRSMYPDHCDIIDLAPAYRIDKTWERYVYGDEDYTADLVGVAEAWHLPTKPGADDGCHVIAVHGGVLVRECWTRARFPIVRAHWCAPTRGFRGTGLVEQLAGIQQKVNDVLRDLQENLYFGSSLKVMVARNSVNKHHLRARHPVIVEVDGGPANAQFVAPNPISQVAVNFLQMLIQQAYEVSGISQMSAQSKNTLGAGASGKAIDSMEDIHSERFAHVESGWIQFRVALGEGIVDEAKSMYLEAHGKAPGQTYDECPEPITKAELAPWISEHEWDKVDIDAGSYHLVIEPVNFLSENRSGRLAQVSEMGKAGLIPDPTLTADLFDEPDIARMNRGVLGPKHRIDEILEGCADPDVDMMDIMPDPYDNLSLLVLMAKGEMKDAQANKAPSEVIERYQQVIDGAKRLIENGKAGASPSVPGEMVSNMMGPGPNAASLQPDLMGGGMMPAPPPAMGPPLGDPGVPPGAMIQ